MNNTRRRVIHMSNNFHIIPNLLSSLYLGCNRASELSAGHVRDGDGLPTWRGHQEKLQPRKTRQRRRKNYSGIRRANNDCILCLLNREALPLLIPESADDDGDMATCASSNLCVPLWSLLNGPLFCKTAAIWPCHQLFHRWRRGDCGGHKNLKCK